MTQPGWDPRGKVYSTISADKPWEQVGGTYKSAANPVTDREGSVFFADATDSRIYKSDPNGKVALFKDRTGRISALAAGSDGKLYAAEMDRRRIVSYDRAGNETEAARDVDANSLAVTAKNGIYFTDGVHRNVGYIDASGHKRIVYDGGEIGHPSALALSPDQAMLIVADGQSMHPPL